VPHRTAEVDQRDDQRDEDEDERAAPDPGRDLEHTGDRLARSGWERLRGESRPRQQRVLECLVEQPEHEVHRQRDEQREVQHVAGHREPLAARVVGRVPLELAAQPAPGGVEQQRQDGNEEDLGERVVLADRPAVDAQEVGELDRAAVPRRECLRRSIDPFVQLVGREGLPVRRVQVDERLVQRTPAHVQGDRDDDPDREPPVPAPSRNHPPDPVRAPPPGSDARGFGHRAPIHGVSLTSP
jgi:hypothetical protein